MSEDVKLILEFLREQFPSENFFEEDAEFTLESLKR